MYIADEIMNNEPAENVELNNVNAIEVENNAKKMNRAVKWLGMTGATLAIAAGSLLAFRGSTESSDSELQENSVVNELKGETSEIDSSHENAPENSSALIAIETSTNNVYEFLPQSSDPQEWMIEAFSMLHVAYDYNKKDLLNYIFGGVYKEDSLTKHGEIIDEIAYRKTDPSGIDDLEWKMELVPEGTDFDGDSGIIRVRRYGSFKFVDNISVIDLSVERMPTTVTMPDGTETEKDLVLITFWDTVSSETLD